VRLSVVTPTYNYAWLLQDAIDSVAGQPDAPEHVIVDDESNDDTETLLEKAPPNVVWQIAAHAGQSATLNKALSLASGDWIGWLNADEFYLPGAFAALDDALTRNPDADVVYGDAVFVDVDGRLLRLVAEHSFSARVLRWNRCFISTAAMFVRRSAIPERGLDPDLRKVMDWDLFLELQAQRRRFVYVPRPIGAFRVHDRQVTAASTTSRSGRRLAEALAGDDPEAAVLAARHHRPVGWQGAVANQLGALEHGVLKVTGGGYRREVRARTLRGADLRWFRSEDARANADALVALSSG
jgi:glycosyltransferase involved in cell wall biosynthesis